MSNYWLSMLSKITKKIDLKILSGCSLLIFLFCLFANYLRSHTTYFMPKEYKIIKELVDQLASSNYLGNREIPFSIASGAYAEYRAEELGLCKQDNCYYFKNLNPYKNHTKINGININEISKQSYLFNGIEAYAWNDVVWISQSSFQTYGSNIGFLGCTIGHEISHIIFNDHIEQSTKLSEILKDIEEDEIEIYKNLIQKELSRESEILADFNGAKMILKAGYEKDTCLKELTFIAKNGGWPADTDLDSTHPGYIERYESLKKLLDEYDKTEDLISFEPYKWEWKYNRKMNTLIFKPIHNKN